MSVRRSAALALALCSLAFAVPSYSYQLIELVREIGDAGKRPAQRLLSEPRAVALGGDRIYIADTEANRVIVLDEEGKTLLTWGTKGPEPGQFRSPAGIAVDDQGDVYVADGGNSRIQVFSGTGTFLRSFGSGGSGPKQFDDPAGLAVAAGRLYVADAGNSRVQVLTTEGIFLGSLIYKDKKDEMKAPVDVAVDAENRLYVLDSDRNCVRIFDRDGRQERSFGIKGAGTDGFDAPLGIAIDGRGNILVADTGNDKIKKFDGEGKLLGSFGTAGLGPGQFRRAAGIKVDDRGRAYIVDSKKGTLQVIQTEVGDAKRIEPVSPPPSVVLSREIPGPVTALAADKELWGLSGDSVVQLGVEHPKRFGIRGSDPSQLKDPRGIALDATGNLWIADTGNDRLQKFSVDGSLLQVIGRSGTGEGQFNRPSGIAVTPKGNIVVADRGNKRVQVFSPKGSLLGAFSSSGKKNGQFNDPLGVAVDAAENIYVVDREADRVMKHDSAGNRLWETEADETGKSVLEEPAGIVVSPDGVVYVLDGGNGRVQVLDGNKGTVLRAFGNAGSGPGEFREPTGLVLEGSTRLWIADLGNKRVQAFTLRHTPAVPAAVTAQPRMNEVQLSWKPNSEAFFERYAVYRAEDPAGEFKNVATTTEPFYVDRGLASNRSFHYRVSSAAKDGNESALSVIVSAVTPRLVPSTPRTVRLDASEKQITLSWLPNREPFVAHYTVYRTTQLSAGFTAVAKTDRPVYVDGQLSDETLYYYQVTTVGREGDESQPSEVAFGTTPRASLAAPPVEIVKIEMRDIFASAYKHYESHPLGTVTVRNNTDTPSACMKLTFSVKEFMDFPTEIEVPEIAPHQETELALKPVFNNRILEVTENTPLQSEIALHYFAAGETRTVKRSFPVTLYERHAMTWDNAAKIGAFITPKDPPLADFARGVVQPYVDAHPNLHPSIVHARALFAALGVYGLSYIIDPTSPFQEFSEKATVVDYLQYPRDTLARKSGDCDDLSVLFASALENIGISAALVDVPGHVFLAFNTGVTTADKAVLGFPDSLLVPYRGTIWIPVEMTMVGQPFTRAWQKGAEEYRDWSAKGRLDVMEVQKAWDAFRPVTLPGGDGRTVKVKREEIEERFPDELQELGRQRLSFVSAEYLAVLKNDPADRAALRQLGVLYGENGMYTEALEQFQKLLAVDQNDAMALNNIGNIYLLQERLDDAALAYGSALKADPHDVGIQVNMARTLLRMGKKAEAKAAFLQAADADPRVLRRYNDLAAALGVAK